MNAMRWVGTVFETVSFRALCLALGEPRSTCSRTDLGAMVYYSWRCGCRAKCADGQKCVDVIWCEEHHLLPKGDPFLTS